MRRWLGLSLIVFAVGCAGAPTGTPRGSAPEEEEDSTPPVVAPIVKGDLPIVNPPAAVVTTHDPTKRTEELPPPRSQSLSTETLSPPLTEAASDAEVRAEMERLICTDPITFLTLVVDRYDREVKSYRCMLEKQERVKDRLLGVEVVECSFIEKPFSVRMDWKKGATAAAKTAYVKDKNKGNLLALPEGKLKAALAGVVERDPTGSEAMASSRYPITEFGIQVGTRRTLDACIVAKKRGDLRIEFGGVKKLKQLNGRPAWQVKRVGYPAPEDDGITEATYYFDVENWLQIGSYLTGEGGKVIGSYYFRDLELNVKFPEDTFTKAGLKKKN